MTRRATRVVSAPTPTAAAGHHDSSPAVPQPDLQGARCVRLGVDPDVFFPDIGGATLEQVRPQVRRQVEIAKAICRYCPVKRACATWAIQAGFNDGIYGGLTPYQRRHFPRRI